MEEATIKAELNLNHSIKRGADWFYWIAGLSILNSLIILVFDGNWSFIVGLGATQFVDGIALAVMHQYSHVIFKIIPLLIDAFLAGIYVILGFFANKEYKSAFIVGMIIYSLDSLLFLLLWDVLSIAFHVYALYWIYKGYTSIDLKQKLSAPAQTPIDPAI